MRLQMEAMMRDVLVLLLAAAMPCLAKQGEGNGCTLAGTWYGGSVVAYFMTITPAGPDGQFATTGQGMYKNSVMSTAFAGTLEKKGKVYEGPTASLTTNDPAYLSPPPMSNLPDIAVAWLSVEMVDCNTLRTTIPFYGIYFGAFIWKPGTPWTGINWVPNPKVPLATAPDVDLIPILTGNVKPIVETYHRVLETVNPHLLHK